MVAECVVANNSNPAMAQKLAEFLLTPQAQAAALEFGNQIPSNLKTTTANANAQATVDRFKGYMKTVVTEDWDAIKADQLAELNLSPDTIAKSKPHWSERDIALKLEAVANVDHDAIARAFDDNPGWNVVPLAETLPVSTLILGGDHAVYSMLATETAEAVGRATLPRVESVAPVGDDQAERPVIPAHDEGRLRGA